MLVLMANSGYVRRDGSLTRGVLPVQAKVNGMELDEEPPELSCLNSLE